MNVTQVRGSFYK